MSLCPLQVISPAGVVRDSDSGALRMELSPEQPSLLIVAVGKTEPVKRELKSLGFKWNQVNQVWYRLGEVTDLHCGFLTAIAEHDVTRGIYYRTFERRGNEWAEI